ncbi:MAG TPA: sugar kinase [bacterium]|nr:sugar kinase [bacterium]
MKYDLTTFGETMVRVSTRPGQALEAATRVDLYTGGTESNTAVALARLGSRTAWVSRLPDNPLGRRIAADVARHGVDVSGVIWQNDARAGLYFVEFATPPRSTTVTYDRKDSAISRLKPGELDWKFLLDTRILHLTGITPALSAGCARAVAEAIKKARAKKIAVSFDVNYRAKLWPPAAAAKTLAPLMQGVTILVMTREDAETVFKLGGEPERTVREIKKRFAPKIAVLTLGNQGALAFDGKKLIMEPGFPGVEPIDRLGAGDAFTAGLIFGFLRKDLALGLKFGIAMSAMKMGMAGDYFWSSRDEVEQVIRSRGGDVRR